MNKPMKSHFLATKRIL
ncbi:hypothetical protein A2U01_0096465, partial [Trifolium medium]|nr:hypothetical protein [Trifolium medium]